MSGETVGIIRVPIEERKRDASRKAIENLAQLSSEKFERVFVFDEGFSNESDNIFSIAVRKSHRQMLPLRIASHITFQIRLAIAIIKQRQNLNTIIWHAGGYSLLIPMFIARLFSITSLLCVLGDPKRGYASSEYWGKASLILSQIIRILEIISYSNADKIIVFSSNRIENAVIEKFEDKIYTAKFNYEVIPSDVPDFRDRDMNVIYLGRVCDLKGAPVFSGAIREIEQGESKVDKYIFIGDGDLQNELELELNDLTEEGKVVFEGWMERDLAMEYLENSRIFVLPSHSEGLPKALQEAMARGTVPITTPVGSIPDLIHDGSEGVLLNENTPIELANAIESLVENQQMASMMSNQARVTAKENLSFKIALADLERIIED